MRERLGRLSLRLGPPLATGLVLGLIGPFGTYDLLPAGKRIAYWLAVVSVNWMLADMILRQVGDWAGGWATVPRLTVPILGGGLSALPATGIVALANHLSGMGWPQDLTLLFGQVLVLMVAIALPVYSWETKADANDIPPPMQAEPDREVASGLALFLARLPGPPGGPLLCLEMQDHYLVVHHGAGSQMILCRMEDAARELQGLGQRVHRSWWVAADAVKGVERDGQRVLLQLVDRRRIPVGRSYRPALKDAGWL